MIREEFHSLPDLPGPLMDLDLTPEGGWVGIVGELDDPQRLILFGERSVSLPHLRTVRSVAPGRVLVMEGRGGEARVVTPDGEIEFSFDVGDGVEDVTVVPDGFVLTYFDEGVFGGTIGREGLAWFDRQGGFQWGYQSRFGMDAVDIADCDCASADENGDVIFFPYTEYPLVRLHLKQARQEVFWPTPEILHSAEAVTMRSDVAYFYKRDHHRHECPGMIWRWRLGDWYADEVGPYTLPFDYAPVRGLPSGRFLVVAEDGYSILTMDDGEDGGNPGESQR